MGVAAELAERALRQITGNKVCSDIDPAVAEQMMTDAFEECFPWFDEPDVFKTVVTTKLATDGSGEIVCRHSYIDLTAEALEIKTLRKVYEIRLNREYTGDLIRDLLLLPAAPIETQSIMEIAQWNMTWPMVKQVLGRDLRFTHIKSENKIFIDDALHEAVTIVYVPKVTSIEQVTFQKAKIWIFEMGKALIQEAIGRARGKFRSGGVRFETDADALLSESQERKRDLREQLKTLHYVAGIR